MASTKKRTLVSTMASTDKKLEKELLEAGNKLLNPPSSVDNLLHLLCQVGNSLSKVEQAPSESIQKALSPSLKALISDKFIKHSDVDVKVALAFCLSELTRIAAPHATYDDGQMKVCFAAYDDGQMKEVLRLIVSSLENLHDKSKPLV